MREEILQLGGTFEFENCVTDIRVATRRSKLLRSTTMPGWKRKSVCSHLGIVRAIRLRCFIRPGFYGAKGLCNRFSCGAPTEGHQPQPVWRKKYAELLEARPYKVTANLAKWKGCLLLLYVSGWLCCECLPRRKNVLRSTE